MSERERYPAGVPCWVETLQPDPQAAQAFYAALFGWEIAGPGPMRGAPPNQYFVARLRGRDVAGIGSLPDGLASAVWSMHVRVDDAGAAATRASAAGGRLLNGPFDVPPAGRMAVLADPAGAVFCVWEARTREGAQVVNELCAWAMGALLTRDPAAASAFYGAVFGWEPQPLPMGSREVTLFRLPGYVGGEPQQPVPRDVVAVMEVLGPGPVPPHWALDFWIADADDAVARAGRLGASVVVPVEESPYFRTAVLRDPQGATFSVSQLRPLD
jgi:predicted enzyme related to lactoylglutathione lyase